MKRITLFSLILASVALSAQSYSAPLVSAIKDTDLRTDMYQMAGDHFRGREAGTPDELKASAWLAEKARSIGVQPAGEDGTFFQFYEMYRHTVSPQSTMQIGGRPLKLWKDFLVTEPVNADIDSEIIFAERVEPEDLAKLKISRKVLAISPTDKDLLKDMSLYVRRYPGFIRTKYYKVAQALGARGIIFITDDISAKSWEQVLPQMQRGIYGIEGVRDKVSNNIPVFWMKREDIGLLKNNPKISIHLIADTYKYPSVNVIGKIEGTDPKLKNEYVLISGHTDHDGIRNAVKNDSIYNGADDNASTCVAMLAMARAYKKQPARRSILFVFHGAEERGLLGSQWHALHPVVPKESIVAVLNGDMIGRNNIDEAALLGGNAPHMNSADLVKMAEQANDESTKFKYLRDWDSPQHPEYFYFRSDHLPYARLGIPAVFFTSVLHYQYHTPQDESQNIDYKKLYKMTEWMYRTSWKVANTKERPKISEGFKLER